MIAHGAGNSIRAITPAVARQGRDWLRLADLVQALAQETVCAVFPEQGLKRFRSLRWFAYHGLSRARSGVSCPLARVAVWMVALRALGFGREQAQRLVDRLQGIVDLLWPPEEVDIVAASDEEQRCEGEETALQMVVMREVERGDLARVPDYLDVCRRERAAQDSMIRGLEARLVFGARVAS